MQDEEDGVTSWYYEVMFGVYEMRGDEGQAQNLSHYSDFGTGTG